MCGLLGFIAAERVEADDRDAIAEALESIHHRGPDETGVESVGDDVVLAFKRLSIIDVESSHQPLWYADGRYVIVFNGEIYNFAELREELISEYGAEFATSGDTEVIVAAYHAWGQHAVTRLRGMFAFLIWDTEQRRAFGARDRFGIKPLYYLPTERGLYVASEKKSLLPLTTATGAGDADVDPASLSHFLTMQYVPEPATLHQGISRLGAGEWFTYTPGRNVQITRYYTADFRPTPTDDPERLYQEIRETLRESVKAHMVSDVPVGAFLSSGIDSTAIVALAREFNPRIPTFTAAVDVAGYSELAVAERTAEALGVTNTPVAVNAQMMMDALPRIIWHLDDPVADPSLVPLYYVAKTAREQVTVSLSGEGSDELFGGYTIYHEPQSLRSVRSLPDQVQQGLSVVAKKIPQGVRGRSFLERGTTPIERRYYGNARIFTERQKSQLMRAYPSDVRYHDVTEPMYAECAHLGDVEKMQYIDMCTWLCGDILLKADRMSMAHSLEVRVPFLDPKVFEIASVVPTRLKVPPRSKATKVALRRALVGVVPPHVIDRPKWGFPTPIRAWLRNEMYAWAADLLGTSGAGGLLDLGYVRRLLDDHKAGEGDYSREIWTVLVFCIWHSIFIEGAINEEGTAGTAAAAKRWRSIIPPVPQTPLTVT